MRSFIFILLTGIWFTQACSDDSQYCVHYVDLIAIDNTKSICGGSYLFRDGTDTLRIRISSEIDSWLEDNQIERSDFPLALNVELVDLDKTSSCPSITKMIDCIRKRD